MGGIDFDLQTGLPPRVLREALGALPEIHLTLAEMPILQDINFDTIALLASGARRFELGRSEPVFERGSSPTGLYFVISGGVKLMTLGPDNRARVVELFQPCGMFGEIGVFTGAAYRTWTQTIAPSVLLEVSRERVLAAVDCDHKLAVRMLTAVTARTQRLIDGISCSSPSTAAVRVAAYILELADRSATPDGPIVLPASKGTIASLLNLSQESLSRVLRRMKDAGLLMVSGRRIRIRDRQGLSRILCGEVAARDIA